MEKISKEERIMKQQEYAKKMVEYLPLLRAAAKLTQNQIAKRLAITRTSIIHFETKKRKLPFHIYLALVLVFMQNEDSQKLIKSFELYDNTFLQDIL